MKSKLARTFVSGNTQIVNEPNEYACLASEVDTFVPDDVQNGDLLVVIDEHEALLWDADSGTWV